MERPSLWLVNDLWVDLKMILAANAKPLTLRNVLWAVSSCDGFILLMMYRTRKWTRRLHIPFANRFIRLLETVLFAIEISNDAELGHGVFFMHTVGTVIGGDSKIGDGCLFLGNNTVGQGERIGYPRIGAGTIVGAGARVLGKIEIGRNCALGANAVVVADVPDGKVALGIPARVAGDNKRALPPAQP